MTISELPFLDPAARVEPVAGPPVRPQRVPPPATMTIFWPGAELSPEAIEANTGRMVKITYDGPLGQSFAREGKITRIVSADGGSLVTIERPEG